MLVNMCKSKIHRATVTETELGYIGSITIDEDLILIRRTVGGIHPGQVTEEVGIARPVLWPVQI